MEVYNDCYGDTMNNSTLSLYSAQATHILHSEGINPALMMFWDMWYNSDTWSIINDLLLLCFAFRIFSLFPYIRVFHGYEPQSESSFLCYIRI
jgi:hypothetical protein